MPLRKRRKRRRATTRPLALHAALTRYTYLLRTKSSSHYILLPMMDVHAQDKTHYALHLLLTSARWCRLGCFRLLASPDSKKVI
ncbi:hypothetical protein E2C01_100212 [Portunus trituberculatus]|uniref:Uncharacterized protein n=1 Tax=Portunus trituberculatus TaxID=210409 RepID=A0A5B7KGT4_PORTR|nr:hypothetical protein [Portunus trituberculatus]